VEQARGVAAVDRRTLAKLLDTWGGFLDAGLPSLVFVCVFTFGGRELKLSLIVAVAVALILAVVRLLRHDRLGSIAAGLFGMVLSAVIAYRSGEARNVYLLGLITNAVFLLLYGMSVLIRWPVLGVLIGLIRQDVKGWRQDADLLRGFSRATLLWTAMFFVRLCVQVPLYVTDHVAALGTLRVILGWPLTLCVLVGTFVVLRQSVGEGKWETLRDDLIATYTGTGATRVREHQAVKDRQSADEDPDGTQPSTPDTGPAASR
jgi:Protein of unknown function (DUF3159)